MTPDHRSGTGNQVRKDKAERRRGSFPKTAPRRLDPQRAGQPFSITTAINHRSVVLRPFEHDGHETHRYCQPESALRTLAEVESKHFTTSCLVPGAVALTGPVSVCSGPQVRNRQLGAISVRLITTANATVKCGGTAMNGFPQERYLTTPSPQHGQLPARSEGRW